LRLWLWLRAIQMKQIWLDLTCWPVSLAELRGGQEAKLQAERVVVLHERKRLLEALLSSRVGELRHVCLQEAVRSIDPVSRWNNATHMHIHMHAHMHAQAGTHTCTHTHTHIRTQHMHTHMHAHMHAHMHSQMQHTHMDGHTHTQAHTHTHTCKHTFTYTHAHTHARTCMHTQTCTHTCTHMHTQTHMHTCRHTNTCRHTCTHARTHTHAHTHTHMHTYTHTHTCRRGIGDTGYSLVNWNACKFAEGGGVKRCLNLKAVDEWEEMRINGGGTRLLKSEAIISVVAISVRMYECNSSGLGGNSEQSHTPAPPPGSHRQLFHTSVLNWLWYACESLSSTCYSHPLKLNIPERWICVFTEHWIPCPWAILQLSFIAFTTDIYYIMH